MALEMMNEECFVPTIHLTKPDPTCGDLDCIMSELGAIQTEFIQSNTFAFGGINTSLIFKRWS